METTFNSVELAKEEAVLLPAREVPAFVNVGTVYAVNGAWAVNGLSLLSSATAAAAQVISLSQS